MCFRGRRPFKGIGKGDQKGFYANSDSIKVVQYINSGEWGQCLVRGWVEETAISRVGLYNSVASRFSENTWILKKYSNIF